MAIFPSIIRSLVSAPLLYQALEAMARPQKHVEQVRFWQHRIEKLIGVPLIDADLRALSRLSGFQVVLLTTYYLFSRKRFLTTFLLVLTNSVVTVANGVTNQGLVKKRWILGFLVESGLWVTWWYQRPWKKGGTRFE